MAQQQSQERLKLHVSRRVVPAELDLDEVSPVPATRARVIGMQQELLEALGADDFQDRLCECERELRHSPFEFRKRRQQLVLKVQAEILPRYGLEGSLRGVAEMLEGANDFEDDAEVAANIEAINALIWKPSPSHRGHKHHPCDEATVRRLGWTQHNGARHDDAGVARPKATQPEEGAFDMRYVGVELDMDEIPVPATRNREQALSFQEELRKHYAADDFQERLRKCEQAHGSETLEFRREHMNLVLEAQAAVLPKWGLGDGLQGAHDMVAASEAFKKDPEVAANIEALEALIWRSGHAPGVADVEVMAQKREI